MKKEPLATLINLINDLAWQIRNLKEAECENSGENWYNRFIKECPVPSDFI